MSVNKINHVLVSSEKQDFTMKVDSDKCDGGPFIVMENCYNTIYVATSDLANFMDAMQRLVNDWRNEQD